MSISQTQEPDAVREMWLGLTADRIRGVQSDMEAWGDLTAEPRGVDYVETDAAGRPGMWLVPKECAEDRVLLCIHGGGFVSGSIYTHRKLFAHLAKAAGARALLFDYRLVPAHTHPAPLEDTVAVYRWLLEEHDVDPARVAFAGDSSGGGLAISAQLRARELGLPLPAAGLLISPWLDMRQSGASYQTNRSKDAFFYKEVVDELATMFLGPDGDPEDPLASPLYADLTGISPLHIQVGGDETLLDDSRAFADRARAAGVEVELEVFPGQQHTFQMAAGRAPEADRAIARLAGWVEPRLGLASFADTVKIAR